MTCPPPPANGPPMGDALGECWARLAALEDIAERLAATSADPIAVADWWLWKAGR